MKEDLRKLQGAWSVISLEIEGKKMSEGAFNGSRIMVEGKRFTTVAMGATYEGELKIDDTKKPKTFELLFSSGPEKGNTSLGIYELTDDQWKICLTITGKTRPVEFLTKPKSGHALEILVRSKATNQQVGSEKSSSPTNLQDLNLVADPEIEGEWQMVSCVRDGDELDKSMVKSGRRVVNQNETTVSFGGQLFLKAFYSVDQSLKPKTIDYIITEGVGKGQRQLGIYRLEAGLLKLCFASPGEKRPGEFSSVTGDGRTYAVWKQLKK